VLAVEIFERIRHQPVLSQDNDDIVGPENEVAEIAPVDSLHAAERAKRRLDLQRGGSILLLLRQVVAEIGT
jgi:hypothetical protein